MKYKRIILVLPLLLVMAAATAQQPRRLTLSEAVRFAVDHHPSLNAAAARIEEARAQGLSLTSQFGLKVSLNGYAASGKGQQIFTSSVEPLNYMTLPDKQAAIANGTLMFPIYTGGRSSTARAISSSLVAQASAEAKVVELDLRWNVRIAFAAAILKEDLLQAEVAGLQAASEIEQVTKAMFAAGKIAEAFVLKAEAERAKAERRVAAATAERNAAIAAFKAAIGAKQSNDIVPGEWDVAQSGPASLQEAIEIALKDRPELSAHQKNLAAQTAKATFAKQSYLPELNLMAMADFMTTRSEGDNFYKVGLVASFPLMDSGSRRAEANENRAKARQVKAEFDAAVLDIERQVAEAWAAWAAVPAAIKAGEAEAKAAAEAYKIVRLRYEAGRAIQAEVSQALADFVAALAAKAETLELQRRAWADLARSIGA